MSIITFPTGRDISIEVAGQRLAAAQSYKASSVCESRFIESFGSPTPVGSIPGQTKYLLELTRVALAKQEAGGQINFHTISNFNVAITRPGRKITYTGCQWAAVGEAAELAGTVYETMRVVAGGRTEVAI